MNPVNISSALPVITPAANPAAAGAQPSPAANVSTPAAGNFTVVIGMSAKTAQLFGLIAAWLVVLLVATKLVGDHLAARRAQKKKKQAPRPRKAQEPGRSASGSGDLGIQPDRAAGAPRRGTRASTGVKHSSTFARWAQAPIVGVLFADRLSKITRKSRWPPGRAARVDLSATRV